MGLSAVQFGLLHCLRKAVASREHRQVIYRSEYLGYLPFALYHWITYDDEDLSLTFPSTWCLDWSRSDLDALVASGYLRYVGETQNPNDNLETSVTYEILPE